MTTYSSTVSNGITLFGAAPTYKWDSAEWDNFRYSYTTQDLMTIFYKGIIEGLNVDDNLIRELVKRFYEQISADDNLIKHLSKTLSEQISADDNFSKYFIVKIIETLTTSDAWFRPLYKYITDNISLTDAIEKTIFKILEENCSIQDLEILYKQRGSWFEKEGDFRDLAKTWEQNWTEVN